MNLKVLNFLYDDPELGFRFLTDLTGAHYPERVNEELSVVYHLHNLVENTRMRVKLYTPVAQPDVYTVTGLFSGANWMERETYDFYGIEFTGHPRLTRILLPEDWVGWPLRKDSPLGYEEVAFTHNTPGRTVPAPQLRKLAPKKVRYRAH